MDLPDDLELWDADGVLRAWARWDFNASVARGLPIKPDLIQADRPDGIQEVVLQVLQLTYGLDRRTHAACHRAYVSVARHDAGCAIADRQTGRACDCAATRWVVPRVRVVTEGEVERYQVPEPAALEGADKALLSAARRLVDGRLKDWIMRKLNEGGHVEQSDTLIGWAQIADYMNQSENWCRRRRDNPAPGAPPLPVYQRPGESVVRARRGALDAWTQTMDELGITSSSSPVAE
jgi:hypothetical protein